MQCVGINVPRGSRLRVMQGMGTCSNNNRATARVAPPYQAAYGDLLKLAYPSVVLWTTGLWTRDKS